MKKLISIITPTFNEETNIEKLSNAIAIQMQEKLQRNLALSKKIL